MPRAQGCVGVKGRMKETKNATFSWQQGIATFYFLTRSLLLLGTAYTLITHMLLPCFSCQRPTNHVFMKALLYSPEPSSL